MKISKSHPRYESLKTRNLIVECYDKGVTSIHGLIAQGRGEAFDYLLGEKTNYFAKESIEAAACLMLIARHPVISVNGNSAALASGGIAMLANILDAPLEVNIFHASRARERNIRIHLLGRGAKKVLMPDKNHQIEFLESNRRFVNGDGIYAADVIFVPLEDGDRTEALIRNGKKIITVDLNPLSRTAKSATITIVDNLIRAIPLLVKKVQENRHLSRKNLESRLANYNNSNNLRNAVGKLKRNIKA